MGAKCRMSCASALDQHARPSTTMPRFPPVHSPVSPVLYAMRCLCACGWAGWARCGAIWKFAPAAARPAVGGIRAAASAPDRERHPHAQRPARDGEECQRLALTRRVCRCRSLHWTLKLSPREVEAAHASHEGLSVKEVKLLHADLTECALRESVDKYWTLTPVRSHPGCWGGTGSAAARNFHRRGVL